EVPRRIGRTWDEEERITLRRLVPVGPYEQFVLASRTVEHGHERVRPCRVDGVRCEQVAKRRTVRDRDEAAGGSGDLRARMDRLDAERGGVDRTPAAKDYPPPPPVARRPGRLPLAAGQPARRGFAVQYVAEAHLTAVDVEQQLPWGGGADRELARAQRQTIAATAAAGEGERVDRAAPVASEGEGGAALREA